jgi:hypothetical protein
MQPTCPFPNRVVARVNHPFAEGLAVSVCFGMRNKNNFGYTLFLGPGGIAEVSKKVLLRAFHARTSIFIMDNVDPEAGFNGRITARVLNTEDSQGAVKASKLYSKYCAFPEGYENNLRAALARGQTPDDYHVELELEQGGDYEGK